MRFLLKSLLPVVLFSVIYLVFKKDQKQKTISEKREHSMKVTSQCTMHPTTRQHYDEWLFSSEKPRTENQDKNIQHKNHNTIKIIAQPNNDITSIIIKLALSIVSL